MKGSLSHLWQQGMQWRQGMPAELPGKRSSRAHVSTDTYTAPDWAAPSTSPRAAGSSSSASGAAAPMPRSPSHIIVPQPSSPPDPVQTGPALRLYRKQTGGITGPFRREFNANPRTHRGLGRISWSHLKPLCTPAVWAEGAGPPCPPPRPLATGVGRLNSFAHVRETVSLSIIKRSSRLQSQG